jgi:hypothetical protein
VTRALLYVPDAFQETWIVSELTQLRISVQTARSVDQLVSALIEDPPPRPQLLFADLEAMSPAELLHLCCYAARYASSASCSLPYRAACCVRRWRERATRR